MKKTILISGGSDGLGRALAEQLTAEHQVVILAHNAAKTEQTAKELGCDFVVADVTDAEQLETAVVSVIAKYGTLDCLVNNAGIWIQGALETNDPNEIKRVMDVNTLGTMLLTRTVLPHMKAAKHGRIINIISQAGLNSKPDRSVYGASKWAITGFTKCLVAELAGTGVTVSGFYPGAMKTNLFAAAGVEKDMSKYMELPGVVHALIFLIENPDNFQIAQLEIASA